MKVFKKAILGFLVEFGIILGISNIIVREELLINLQVAVITVILLNLFRLILYIKNKFFKQRNIAKSELNDSEMNDFTTKENC